MRPINDLLSVHADTIGERIALDGDDGVFSFRDLDRMVCDTAPVTSFTPQGTSLDVARLIASWRVGQPVTLGDSEWAAPRSMSPWTLEQPLVVLYTSGSEGQPTPVVVTLEQALFSVWGGAARLGHHLDDVWAASLPLTSMGGLAVVFRMLVLGITAKLRTRFDAKETAGWLEGGGCTVLSLVPTTLSRTLDAMTRPVSPRVRAVVVGGAGMGETLRQRAQQAGLPVFETYGATETTAMVATGLANERGIPVLPYARLSSPNGCLRAEGPQVQNRAWQSRDIGEVEQHHVRVAGRADCTVLSGGKKTSLEYTERALADHPAIASAVCVPWHDAGDWGTAVAAWLEPSTSTPPLAELVHALPPNQRPMAYFFAPTRPSARGKYSQALRGARTRLTQEFAAGRRPGSVCFATAAYMARAAALTGMAVEPLPEDPTYE